MLKINYKKFIILLLIIFNVFCLAFASQKISAAGDYGLKDTVGATGGGLIDPAKKPVEVIIGEIIGIVLSFLGVLFLIMIINAGLRWMIAQGNEAEIDKAKQTIIAAIFGLMFVLAAYAMTAFIGKALT